MNATNESLPPPAMSAHLPQHPRPHKPLTWLTLDGFYKANLSMRLASVGITPHASLILERDPDTARRCTVFSPTRPKTSQSVPRTWIFIYRTCTTSHTNKEYDLYSFTEFPRTPIAQFTSTLPLMLRYYTPTLAAMCSWIREGKICGLYMEYMRV